MNVIKENNSWKHKELIVFSLAAMFICLPVYKAINKVIEYKKYGDTTVAVLNHLDIFAKNDKSKIKSMLTDVNSIFPDNKSKEYKWSEAEKKITLKTDKYRYPYKVMMQKQNRNIIKEIKINGHVINRIPGEQALDKYLMNFSYNGNYKNVYKEPSKYTNIINDDFIEIILK